MRIEKTENRFLFDKFIEIISNDKYVSIKKSKVIKIWSWKMFLEVNLWKKKIQWGKATSFSICLFQKKTTK